MRRSCGLIGLLLGVPALAQEGPPASDETLVPEEVLTAPEEVPEAPDPAPDPAPVEPSLARRCAEAARGMEVEVCLDLAARHPEQVDAVAAALRAHIDRASSADRDLLAAVLQLLSEEGGADGAAALGALDDPRAVRPLAFVGAGPDEALAVAATRALGTHPEGLGVLVGWLEDRQHGLLRRTEAARALGQLALPEGGDALLTLLRTPRTPPPLRRAAEETLRESFPDRADEIGRGIRSGGALWLSGATGWGLGYALGAAGHFGQSKLAVVGAASGGVAGVTGGYLMGRAWPMDASDAAFLTVNGVTGTVAGVLVGNGLDVADREDAAWVGGLVGGAVGYGAGIGLRKAHRGNEIDTLEATLLGSATSIAVTTSITAGLRRSGYPSRPGIDIPSFAGGLGLAGGMVGGHLVAPLVKPQRLDWGFIGLTTLWGAFAGGALPMDDFEVVDEFAVAGGMVGLIGGYAVSPLIEPTAPMIVGGTTGLLYGSTAGMGLGLMIAPDASPRVHEAVVLAGGTLGAAAGTILGAYALEPRVDGHDVVLTQLATGWATWQSVGWAIHLDTGSRGDGAAILVPAAVGATFGIASRAIDVPIPHQLAATSCGVWGGYLTGVAAELADEPILPYMLAGSDGGLVIGGLLVSPLVKVRPVVIGLADAGGVGLGSMAALGTALFTRDTDAILVASLVGSGIGIAGGATLGAVLVKEGSAGDVALWRPQLGRIRLPGRWSVSPTAIRTRSDVAYGATLQVDRW